MRLPTAAILALMVAVFTAPLAAADEGDPGETSVNEVKDGLLTGTGNGEAITGETPGSDHITPQIDNAGETVVVDTELADQFCTGLNWSPDCVQDEAPEEPVVTTALVTQAFQFTPLPPQTLIVQPPNGRTLVNFETNFYTDAPDVLPIIAVPILDQVVELRVWPESFTWLFGDGRSVTTTERGAPYPTMGVTHEYRRKGLVAPSLDTTYAAQWRLQGQGAWQPVDGTVTIAGAPAQLDVLTATPQLVG